jgi:hypothetical protein
LRLPARHRQAQYSASTDGRSARDVGPEIRHARLPAVASRTPNDSRQPCWSRSRKLIRAEFARPTYELITNE